MSANQHLSGISALLNRLQSLGAAPWQSPEKCDEALQIIAATKAKLERTEAAFVQIREGK